MREVDFRTIDRLFIKMSINDKIWVIFGLFFVALASIAGGRYYQEISSFEQSTIYAAEQRLQGIISVGTPENIKQMSSVTRVSSLQAPKYKDGVATVTAKANDGQVYQLVLDNKPQAEQVQSQAITSLGLSALWAVPFAIFCYWVATFLGGALWVLYTTTQRIGEGDLTSRLGFHPGRDEFGTIGCALDKAMDTLTELVVTVKENATTMSETSASFEQEMRLSETQISQQYASLDSVATAMEEMTASAKEVSNISQQATAQTESDGEHIEQS
ncbi:methyl-accepting chemotaxis protein, partial [Vibrio sp. M260118]|uniref:methyl-accepting chemotaxis protein n=1 Tax=Vibrio sp. M260118 TaxID=3020896 RepID=UPI002F42A3F0